MGHIKRSLFLIFVFLFNVSCAEDTCKQLVNSFLNADSIVMQLDITRCINNGDVFGAKVTAIKVSKNNQVIMDNNDPKFASDEGWRTMYFEDLNHDGFADIVLVSLPYSASVDYSFLLFDKETQTYQAPISDNGYGYEPVEDFILVYSSGATSGTRIRNLKNVVPQYVSAEINEAGTCVVEAKDYSNWVSSEKLRNRLCQK